MLQCIIKAERATWLKQSLTNTQHNAAGKEVAETLVVVDRESKEDAQKKEVVAGEEAAAAVKVTFLKVIANKQHRCS